MAAAALAGCANGRTGQTSPTSPTGPTSPPAVASAEAMKDRLANQARAIIELSAENEKLLAKIAELRKEAAEPADQKLLAKLDELRKEVAQLKNEKDFGEGRIVDLLERIAALEKEVARLQALLKGRDAPAPAPPPAGKK